MEFKAIDSEKIKTELKSGKKTFIFWCVLIFVSFVFALSQWQNSRHRPQVTTSDSIDTFIPEGFVLLPIELSNVSSLDGFLHDKGVVDLYTADPSSMHSEKAASAVKIIRSPQNPEHFAVLVPEQKAGFLIERFSSFYAIIQNPRTQGVKVKTIQKRQKRLIVIEKDANIY